MQTKLRRWFPLKFYEIWYLSLEKDPLQAKNIETGGIQENWAALVS